MLPGHDALPLRKDWLKLLRRCMGNGGAASARTALGSGTTGDALFLAATAAAARTTLGVTAGGNLIGVQVFTVTGVYTPTTGTSSVIVEVQAPGGGSGGAVATTVGQWSAGRPGAGGAWGRKRITSAFAGVTVTIGAAGTAGAAGDNAGGAGGTSSFGALLSCTGGAGGGGSGTVQTAAGFTAGAGAAGGAATGADVHRPGSSPMSALAASTTVLQMPPGGASSYSPGAPGYVVTSNNSAGLAPTGYGGGASGPANINGAFAATAGAAGAPGIAIVYEYA